MFLCLATLPYVMDLLPKPDSSLWESHLETFVEKSNQNNFDEAYEAWHSANETFFSLQCHYFQRITLSPGLWNKLTAGRHLWSLRKSFKQALNRPQIKEAFAHNGLHASLLTPSMRYTTKQILRRAHHKKSLHELEQYQQYDFNTYTTLNANSIEQQLRVYSANVLFFPYPLSYFFGGLSPWQERISSIVATILESKADIVCLQEVWGHQAAKALIDHLMPDYACFIYDIGDQDHFFNPAQIGFNSGLFIASKVPLRNISFTPFPKRLPRKSGVQRGILKAQFTANNETWTMIATHLQPGETETDKHVRAQQFIDCQEALQGTPGFILGDLNINAFSQEFFESPLSKEFAIPYLEGHTFITADNATATDYFNDLTHTKPEHRPLVTPRYEILDYCVSKKAPSSQKKIPLFSIDQPDHSLSDHHAILTTWQF